EALEKVGGATAPDLDLRERCEIEDRRRTAACLVLDPDRGRPQPSRPAVRAHRLVAVRAVGLEPVHALPPGLLAEGGAEVLEARVHGRDAQGTAGRALVPWVLDVVVGGVDLVG